MFSFFLGGVKFLDHMVTLIKCLKYCFHCTFLLAVYDGSWFLHNFGNLCYYPPFLLSDLVDLGRYLTGFALHFHGG
jgi:hypothetical protein